MVNKYKLKIILVGDTGVGKTSLVRRLNGENFSDQYQSTIGIDFRIIPGNFKNKSVKVYVWNTAGQERFYSIVWSYFRCSQAVVVMYDCSSHESFKKVPMWIRTAREIISDNVPILLVANKTDSQYRCISAQKGRDFAKSENIEYREMSTKTGTNTEGCLDGLVQKVFEAGLASPEVTKIPSPKVMQSVCCTLM